MTTDNTGVPTAEEFISGGTKDRLFFFSDQIDRMKKNGYLESITIAMRAFAKLHLEAQKQEILKQATTETYSYGIRINKESISTAYNIEENVK